MGAFDVTDAAFAGFGLIGRRPLSAIAWAALIVLWVGLLIWLFSGTLVTAFGAFTTAAQTRDGSASPQTTSAILGAIGGLLGFFALLWIGVLVLSTMITCAVYRAILEPEDSAFFSLRLGAREGWVLLVAFVQGVLLSVVQGVIGIPLGALSLISMPDHSSPLGNLGVFFIGRLAVLGFTLWLYLRFSMTGPMTFTDRKFRLFESWALTRGQDLRLLGVGLLIAVAVIGIEIVLLIIAAIGVIATVGTLAVGGDFRTVFEGHPPSTWLRLLAPVLAVVLALGFIAAAVLIPVSIAPWARIYQRLAPRIDPAEAFA